MISIFNYFFKKILHPYLQKDDIGIFYYYNDNKLACRIKKQFPLPLTERIWYL
jgi:hypothetical protein